MWSKVLGDGPRFFVTVLRGISIALSIFYIVAFAVDVAPILGSYENVNIFMERMMKPLGIILGIWIIYTISAMIINSMIAFLQKDHDMWDLGNWMEDWDNRTQKDYGLNIKPPLRKIQTFRWNGGYVSMGQIPFTLQDRLRPVALVLSNTLSALGFSEKRRGLNDGKIKFKPLLAPDFKLAYFQVARRPFTTEFEQLDQAMIDQALSTAVGKPVDHIYVPPDEFYYQVEL